MQKYKSRKTVVYFCSCNVVYFDRVTQDVNCEVHYKTVGCFEENLEVERNRTEFVIILIDNGQMT